MLNDLIFRSDMVIMELLCNCSDFLTGKLLSDRNWSENDDLRFTYCLGTMGNIKKSTLLVIEWPYQALSSQSGIKGGVV